MGDIKLSALPGPARTKAAAGEPPAVWPARAAVPDRHGAISRQLFSYSHYKSWSDRMRTTWEKDADEPVTEETPRVR
jgi:hypothetical protein